MRFDGVFALRPNSCAGRILQPFFGVVGTFISSLFGGSVIRNAVTYASHAAFAFFSNSNGGAAPPPAAGMLEYELHVIKTAHLGLCQASSSEFPQHQISILWNSFLACSLAMSHLGASVILVMFCGNF